MNKFSMIGFALLVSFQASASNIPPGFDLTRFNALMTQAIQHGQVGDVGDGTQLRMLSRLIPQDATQSHTAQYFSTLGYGDENPAHYQASEVILNAETWQLGSDKVWQIDQWQCNFDLQGNLVEVDHGSLKEQTDGTVLDDSLIPTQGVNGAAELQKCGSEMTSWFGTLSR